MTDRKTAEPAIPRWKDLMESQGGEGSWGVVVGGQCRQGSEGNVARTKRAKRVSLPRFLSTNRSFPLRSVNI